jgi:hypothetical protein
MNKTKQGEIIAILNKRFELMQEAEKSPFIEEWEKERAYYHGMLDILVFALPAGLTLQRNEGKHEFIKTEG